MDHHESRGSALARLASLSLAAAAFEPTSSSAAPTPVRLGTVPNDLATPAVYAQAAGLFADAGLEVQIEAISSGAAVAAAIAGGSIDMGLSSLFAVITAHARGFPLTLVAGGSVYDTAYPPATGLVINLAAPLHGPTDLDGKIVSAAALNDLMVANIREWVDKNGGHSETMQFVELTGAQIAPALDTGRIDGAGVVNPVLANLIATGKYRTLGDPSQGIAPHYLTTAWIATKDYVQKNAATVKSFGGVLAKASAYCNAHGPDTAPLLAKFSGVDPATIARMARSHYAAGLDPRDIQPVIDSAAKYKIIPKSFPAHEIVA